MTEKSLSPTPFGCERQWRITKNRCRASKMVSVRSRWRCSIMNNKTNNLHIMLLCFVFTQFLWTALVHAKTNRYDTDHYGPYGQSGEQTWLANSAYLTYQLKGCVWAVTENNEGFGCLGDSSEDGYTYWYKMANCYRAQVAFSVYGSDSSSNQCKSSDFKESYHTQDGLVGFTSSLTSYNAAQYISYSDVYNFPTCAWDDTAYAYVGLACSEDGEFILSKFNDQYCQNPSGSVYNTLDSFNTKFKKEKNVCKSAYDSYYNNVLYNLIGNSRSCSPLNDPTCGDDDGSKMTTYKAVSSAVVKNKDDKLAKVASTLKGIENTFKYALGGVFLIASFIMFLGILMMNRRKRRAFLNRKLRKEGGTSNRRSMTKDRSERSRARSRTKVRPGSSARQSRSHSKGRRTSGDDRSKRQHRSRAREGSTRTKSSSNMNGGTIADLTPADQTPNSDNGASSPLVKVDNAVYA